MKVGQYQKQFLSGYDGKGSHGCSQRGLGLLLDDISLQNMTVYILSWLSSDVQKHPPATIPGTCSKNSSSPTSSEQFYLRSGTWGD